MPNQFLSDEFGDIEDYFVTDYWLIDNFVGDTLWGWGISNAGRLGEGTTGNSARDVPITTFAGGTNWKQVMMDKKSSSAAIKTDGTLWTWGWNTNGELGINEIARAPFPTGLRPTPVTTFAGGNNWKSVAGGYAFTVAIKTDGSLWTWGRNHVGQLGINNTDQKNTPVTTFAGGTNWKSIAGGFFHTAAIKTDGSLWVWGNNGYGQLGINLGNVNRVTPVTTFAGGTDWKSVSCGQYYTAAIKTDGSLWSWGLGTSAQLGDNNIITRSTPVTTFAGGNNWKSVACGWTHTAAIKTDGSLWNWGLGTSGQLGNNTNTNRSTPVTTFSGGTNWKQVSAGKGFSVAIKTDGTLWGWGENNGRNLGLGSNNQVDRSTPVTTFAGGNNWKQLFCGESSTMAIKSGLNVDLS
jgi:alpha-tubulin suppressor-like RCC1 family protein